MQACMHLRLPKLSRELDEIQSIADKFHLEIGIDLKTHEEFIIIIRNKSTLGHSEKQYIEAVYYGAKALIRKELEIGKFDITIMPEVLPAPWVRRMLKRDK